MMRCLRRLCSCCRIHALYLCARAFRREPRVQSTIKELLAGQDAVLLTERLQAWTDDALEKDLQAYMDVDPEDAIRMRDLILEWLKDSV